MANITGPRPPSSTTTRAANAHRVHSSCDRCRSRKTKCIDPIPGPCRYCARTGATCTIATPRRRRPFYHVTEEEYQLSMSILSRVFHGQQLNLESLRKISKAIKDGSLVLPTLNAENYIEPNQSTPEDDDDDDSSADITHGWSVDGDNLHESLGSMMKDSKNVLRYVGAQSDIPFNGAVTNLCKPPQKTDIIPPAKLGAYPPKENIAEKHDIFWLPPKETCFRYVKKYREEVHCMYWLYPEAKLLQRIEDTYAWYETTQTPSTIKREHNDTPTPHPRKGEEPSISWICSLYAMCAIGAIPRSTIDNSPSPGPYSHSVARTSEDYMALVKDLKPKVEDSADIDSIRALAISAIALENALSRTTAYLYIGTSIQIAWSLGLHRNQLPISGSEEERERNRRIWWTLTTLDLEIGLRGGSPTLIDERILDITTSLPLERIGHEPVKPEFLGVYTPRKWLSAFVQLGGFKREIIRDIYTERLSKSISFSNVSDVLLRLRKWHDNLPAHLKLEAYETAPEFHRRAIIVLHLHYWSTRILITRPFLLYLVLKHTELDHNSKIAHEKMAMASIGAARKSVALFQNMIRDRTISSLTTFDSTTVLRCITIFMCAFVYYQTPDIKQDANDCMDIAKSMEQLGFARMIVAEVPLHLKNLHMSLQPASEHSQENHVVASRELWPTQQLTSLQNQQGFMLEVDDLDALDSRSLNMAFEMDDVFQLSHQYRSFDQAWQ
ncbi:fungal-specific transcription factor domain-containing protein [Boeremia exigua]|uniref:fungal-specific transcription factor domain-containing protein n=1 Tax=Boeremia exigua TaxID=749465 RepID=UPI001E8CB997|nr:fungal-specific transcription factor domain-containing protein [Boeremia exigua]KAH6642404.1 fungal-specific transcription factor domain-containing protein [Boeremia exigua]